MLRIGKKHLNLLSLWLTIGEKRVQLARSFRSMPSQVSHAPPDHLGAILAKKSTTKLRKLKNEPTWGQNRTKMPPERAKMAQDSAKMAQEGAKMAPRWPKMAPRWPKIGQNGANMCENEVKMKVKMALDVKVR